MRSGAPDKNHLSAEGRALAPPMRSYAGFYLEWSPSSDCAPGALGKVDFSELWYTLTEDY